MTAAQDFQQAIRRGRRSGRGTLVAHYWTGDTSQDALVGFAVSKAVGNSVVRHRVVRRLRHASRPYLASLPPGSMLVIRATPAAGSASSIALTTDVDRAVSAVLRTSA